MKFVAPITHLLNCTQSSRYLLVTFCVTSLPMSQDDILYCLTTSTTAAIIARISGGILVGAAKRSGPDDGMGLVLLGYIHDLILTNLEWILGIALECFLKFLDRQLE